jgi:LysR family glycine cleavage system transcriptional activator
MTRLPPLKSLQAFRVAGEEQSFKLAAQRLHVTPTAISQQIKTLEHHLGLSLFKRLTREVELTSEGRQLLPYITKAFKIMEDGVEQLAQDPEPNKLIMTVLPSFAGRWLVPRLGRFQQQAPNISIQLSPSLGLASFEGKDLDLAIRFGQGQYPGLSSRLLLEDYLLPVCHPSLIQANKNPLPQLAKLPYLADAAPDMAVALTSFQQATGITFPPESLHVSDSTMLVEAVLSGQGFAMLRYSLVYELLERGLLICPVNCYLKSSFDFYLVAPELNFQRPKVRQFEHWLRSELKEVTTSWQQFHRQQLNSQLPLN